MRIKIFTIPLFDGDEMEEEMNLFLGTHKILKVESKLANKNKKSAWTFEIRYIDGMSKMQSSGNSAKKDYREILDEKTFAIYSDFREIRKTIAERDNVPAYAIFTNEELAEIAKLEQRNIAAMKKITGIGAKKIEKYAQYFTDETNESLT